MTLATMTLGHFVFNERYMEVPESIGTTGGYQVIQQHDFPGGIRNQQKFGWFAGPIEWRAMFTGPVAQARANELKRICIPGNELTLTIGTQAWLGTVAVFDPRPRHNFMIPYSLTFLPRLDLLGIMAGGGAGGSLTSMIGTSIASLTGLVGGVASDLAAEAFLLIDDVSNALLLASSIAAAISSDKRASIQAQCVTVQQTAAPYIASTDPTVSAPAAAVSVQAGTISNLMGTTTTTKWTVRQVNPNLPAIAAQYLGSASRWTDIATLNGLSDPHPIGVYTLTIPSP